MNKDTPKTDWSVVLSGAAIALAALAAYHNCFSGPFVFDTGSTIMDNPTIRHLWPIGPALNPPSGGLPVSGRPIANLSFALNYALGGLDVRGYHALNLLIHVLAGLTLFGIVRRTLAVASTNPPDVPNSRPCLIALAVALLWTVHPLQTESVTYVAQRAESLMGLFYLLTLYGFIRGAGAENQRAGRVWFGLAIGACLLGMASKEVMATAPLMVLLYDRTFIAGGFREAWRRRRGFYIGLGCTWLLLAYLVAGSGARGGTVGFGTNVPWWGYAFTQFKAIAHYLRLSIWPHPLVIDYGLKWGGPSLVIAIDGLIVGALVAATVIGIRRRSPLGFLGTWFFAILAPSSSVVPVATEIIAEHRMYLPLAAVVTLIVLGLYEVLGKKSVVVAVGLSLGLVFVTSRRNEDYLSARALWAATVESVPDNPGAHNNLGKALLEAKDYPAAAREFTEALRLNPTLAGARNNMAIVLNRQNKVEDAIASYEEALRIAPNYPGAHSNLGRALTEAGRLPEAIAQFEEALRLEPDFVDARTGLGTAILKSGRITDAIAEYQEALRLRPDYAEAHNDLAFALDKTGQSQEAISEYEEALRLKPDYFDAHYNLGNLLAHAGRLPEAIAEYEAALRIDSNRPEAQGNLGSALLQSGRVQEAIEHFKAALRLKPELVEAQANLGSAFLETGRTEEAIACYKAALQLQPDYAAAHYNLGMALRVLGRAEEATAQFDEAARLGARPP